MKKFTVHLSREYVVQIEANNETDARTFTEIYVSGGTDESNDTTRNLNNFQIRHIKPTLNETFYVEEIIS
jgi:hypothetical protein